MCTLHAQAAETITHGLPTVNRTSNALDSAIPRTCCLIQCAWEEHRDAQLMRLGYRLDALPLEFTRCFLAHSIRAASAEFPGKTWLMSCPCPRGWRSAVTFAFTLRPLHYLEQSTDVSIQCHKLSTNCPPLCSIGDRLIVLDSSSRILTMSTHRPYPRTACDLNRSAPTERQVHEQGTHFPHCSQRHYDLCATLCHAMKARAIIWRRRGRQ